MKVTLDTPLLRSGHSINEGLDARRDSTRLSIRFDPTPEDGRVINAIMSRARQLKLVKRPGTYLTVEMSILACHLNGCPLDLDKLLRADDFTFVHDVCGIDRHVSRDTGRLENCFLPRCAAKEN